MNSIIGKERRMLLVAIMNNYRGMGGGGEMKGNLKKIRSR